MKILYEITETEILNVPKAEPNIFMIYILKIRINNELYH